MEMNASPFAPEASSAGAEAGAPAEPRAPGKPLGCWEALRARERDRVRVRVKR